MTTDTEVVENEFGVDVAVRTIRGRACPICMGKIIPSNRAVYQTTGDSSELFALWECERCGFSERYEKPEDVKKLHAAPAKALGTGANPAAGLTGQTSSASVTPTGSKAERRAAAKTAIPPDVQKMLDIMNREHTPAQKTN